MDKYEKERIAKKALSSILDYLEIPDKYKVYAQLITYIEWAMEEYKDTP